MNCLQFFIYNICGFIKVWKVTKQLLCTQLLLLPAGYITAKLHSSTSIGGRDIAVCAKIQDGGRCHLEFFFVKYFGISVCRTSRVICVPNFAKICAIVNELWKINKIQNGGRRHLEFIIFVHFSQMVYFRWQPPLMFVQKSKMAAAAILNYSFVMLDHPRSPFVHLKFPLKFRVDRVRIFRDIAIRKFRKFGLKCLFRPPQNHVFGEFWPPNIIFYHRDPQKALPYAETRVLSHKRSWLVFWCDL